MKIFEKMVQFVNEHKINPIIDTTMDFNDSVSAFDRMKKGEQFGKIVIKIAD